MDYMSIIASTMEASNSRDTTLEAVENSLKNLQKILDSVNA